MLDAQQWPVSGLGSKCRVSTPGCSQCLQGTVNSVKMVCRFHVPLAVLTAKDRSTSVAPLLAVQDHVMTRLGHLRPRGGWSDRQLACVPVSMGASLWRLCSCSQLPPVPLPAMQVCVVLFTGPGESRALYEATRFLPCFSFVLWEELSPQSQPFRRPDAGRTCLPDPLADGLAPEHLLRPRNSNQKTCKTNVLCRWSCPQFLPNTHKADTTVCATSGLHG